MNERVDTVTRRQVCALAVAGVVSVAGCVGGASGDADNGDDGQTPEPYGGWLSGTANFSGTVDQTGNDEVRISVGAGNGLLFEPAAVEVSTGTTVVWEWTGRGGQHNVKEENGAFESELASQEGTTFEQTFDEPGTVRYLCVPHEAVGMRGVVSVVE